MLNPVTTRQVLLRLLHNLKRVYLERQELDKALAAVERMMLLRPTVEDLRDRGLLLAQLGQPTAGWFDLQLYIRLAGAAGAADVEQLRAVADRIWRATGRAN